MTELTELILLSILCTVIKLILLHFSLLESILVLFQICYYFNFLVSCLFSSLILTSLKVVNMKPTSRILKVYLYHLLLLLTLMHDVLLLLFFFFFLCCLVSEHKWETWDKFLQENICASFYDMESLSLKFKPSSWLKSL